MENRLAATKSRYLAPFASYRGKLIFAQGCVRVAPSVNLRVFTPSIIEPERSKWTSGVILRVELDEPIGNLFTSLNWALIDVFCTSSSAKIKEILLKVGRNCKKREFHREISKKIFIS